MQPQSRISSEWENPEAAKAYCTGVSLHSHTSASQETLTFIHGMGKSLPFFDTIMRHYERISRERYGVTFDFVAAHWRPPLLPRMAFDLEADQIQRLGLNPMISITDHDNIEAPLLLRNLPSARAIPVSFEWTAPFGRTAFHLGIHNLPSAGALAWFSRLEQFTSAPEDALLIQLLGELHAIPQVLVVLNHPLWDLYEIGDDAHQQELDRFLSSAGQTVHALELNGLRHARENRAVMRLAQRSSQLLISGGDRHGLEPNAILNLTNATTFTQFVHEIRVERRSHVLLMQQYRQPWEQRILASTLEAITDHPQFSPGWQRWDERAFHPDAAGVMRPMSELWATGSAPWIVRLSLGLVRLLRFRALGRTLSFTCRGVNDPVIESEGLQDLA